MEQFDDFVKVETTDGTDILARYVIAADGMWSTVRKAVKNGIEGYEVTGTLLGSILRIPANAQHLTVWFEPDLLPVRFGCFRFLATRKCGFGILRDRNHKLKDMGRLWKDILTRPHIKEILGHEAIAEGTHKAWPIPSRMEELEATAGEYSSLATLWG